MLIICVLAAEFHWKLCALEIRRQDVYKNSEKTILNQKPENVLKVSDVKLGVVVNNIFIIFDLK